MDGGKGKRSKDNNRGGLTQGQERKGMGEGGTRKERRRSKDKKMSGEGRRLVGCIERMVNFE